MERIFEDFNLSETKSPSWVRALDIVFGLIAVILSVVVLVYQELAILTMIFRSFNRSIDRWNCKDLRRHIR